MPVIKLKDVPLGNVATAAERLPQPPYSLGGITRKEARVQCENRYFAGLDGNHLQKSALPATILAAMAGSAWTAEASDHGHAAVHVDGLAGHVGGFVGGQIDDSRGDFGARAHATGRDGGHDGLLLLVVQLVGHG